jgi:hypothetical protein
VQLGEEEDERDHGEEQGGQTGRHQAQERAQGAAGNTWFFQLTERSTKLLRTSKGYRYR